MESYDWEASAGRGLETLLGAGIRLGEQYANVYFSRQQIEAQLDAYTRVQALRPPAVGLPPLAILMVGAVLVLLVARN